MAFKPYCMGCRTWHTEGEGHVPCAEIDRLSLVIESAVRNADPANLEAVVAALKACRGCVGTE